MNVNLSKTQTEALELITRNGRFGVGPFGGIPWPTVKVLARNNMVRVTYERSRWTGRLVAYAAPKGVA